MPAAQSPPPPSYGVTISHHTVGRRTVLTIEGEIDLATAHQLRTAIDRAVGEGATEIWLDLTPTEFMDSTGLHLLLEARQRLADLNRRLSIICPPGCVRRLFEVTAADLVLTLFDDRAAAHLAA